MQIGRNTSRRPRMFGSYIQVVEAIPRGCGFGICSVKMPSPQGIESISIASSFSANRC